MKDGQDFIRKKKLKDLSGAKWINYL